MKTIGNILWIVLGGFVIALEYFISGFLMLITIIGIPFGIQAFKLGILSLWPFGYDTRNTQSSSGCLSVIFNIIWILIGGIWIFLTHVVLGLLLMITIVGIPFGKQHFKLAALSLTPFGREVYKKN